MIAHQTGVETGSLLINLKCPECGTLHNASVINTVCINETCKSTLFAEYNLSTGINRSVLQGEGHQPCGAIKNFCLL